MPINAPAKPGKLKNGAAVAPPKQKKRTKLKAKGKNSKPKSLTKRAMSFLNKENAKTGLAIVGGATITYTVVRTGIEMYHGKGFGDSLKSCFGLGDAV